MHFDTLKIDKSLIDYIGNYGGDRLLEHTIALAKDMDLSRLNNIFKAVMKRREDKIDPIRSKFGNIEKEDVDIEAKQTYVRLFVATHKEFSFRELLERQNSKSEIVVTFLLILEMIKIGEIEVSQESNDDDIIIVSKIAA